MEIKSLEVVEHNNLVVMEKGNLEVSGRELHMFLGVNTPYHKWFPRMTEYGFTEGQDYTVTDKNVHNSSGGKQVVIDHQMTLDMAKEICMLQRTPKGKKPQEQKSEQRSTRWGLCMILSRSLYFRTPITLH